MLFTRSEPLFSSRGRRAMQARFVFRCVTVAGCSYYIAAAALMALTKLPFSDEGTFGGSALNIIHTGFSGNPSTPPWGLGIPLEQSYKYNFWTMPLYLYALSLWYRVAPATLISGRLLSILGGLAVFALFYRFIRQFAGSRAVAALSVGLLGSCFQFIEDSTYVRMDSLSLLLNLAAWVAYMGLRRGHFYAAIFCSSGLAATSLVTHPNGIIAFFGILVLAVVLDRSRLSVRSGVMMMVGAAGPLAAAASLILQAPAVWLQQMRAHSQYRFDGYLHPLESIRKEFVERYYFPFGGFKLERSYFGWAHLGFDLVHGALLLVLILYIAATVMAMARFRESRLAAASCTIFLITITYFTFFESGKLRFYNIHLLPWFALFSAMLLARLWRERRFWLATAIAGTLVLANSVWNAYLISGNGYGKSYEPVLRVLRENMGPNDVALTHAYFGFDLEFGRVTEDYTLVDVVRRKPLFVTFDHWFKIPADVKAYKLGPDPVAAGMISTEEKSRAVELLESEYRAVLRTPDLLLYKRFNPAAASTGSSK